MKKYKLAILASHPIQYQCPLFQKIAIHPSIDLTVYFCCDYGLNISKDSEFGKSFKWDIPLTKGYKHKFLKNYSLSSKPSLTGQINPGVLSELRRNKFDAIIVHGWMSITNLLVLTFSKTPIFMRSETPLNQELLKPNWKTSIKKQILKILFNRISAFLYIGKENKDFYKSFYITDDKLYFTPYAIDNERFISSYNELYQRKLRLKEELGISPEKVVILFSGKLIDKKCPLDLLYSYANIKENNKALIYIGDGKLRGRLEKYAKTNHLHDVHFVGFKNQSEISKYYILGDIFVLPSGIGETWGLVVNEAMCFKMPIIVSDLVGCGPDLVKHNYNGYIFTHNNINELSSSLSVLIMKKSKRMRYGEQSFRILQGYNYAVSVDNIILALENIKYDEKQRNE